MKDLFVNGVKKYLDSTLILKNITFMVNEGERAGIIGENGSGKTTILKLIAGILTLNHCAGYPYAPIPPGFDEGWVVLPKDTVCAYLDQIPDYKEGVKVIDVLKLAFEEIYSLEVQLRSLEEEMQHLTDADLNKILRKYDNCLKLYESRGGYEAAEKLNRICKGLKFSEEFLNKDFYILSGGEKTTVALGKLLMDNPDILLLDEPTNHLDMESVEWLEEYIRNYKGTVLIVSHDRYFLDHTVTKIIEIESMESETYKGNYSEYVLQKEENLRLWQEHYKEQQKKIGAMENSVKELREWAAKGGNEKFYKRAASIQNKLDRMEKLEKPSTDKKGMRLNLTEGSRSGNIVLKARELKKAYGEKVLFENSEVEVYYGERVALIGQNGSGKTTFLRMLLGEESPDGGTLEFGSSVKAAYLPQQLTFPNEELTLIECFREDLSILEGAAREYLSKFLFYGGNVYKKVKYLSGGERVRLILARLLYQEVNLLILDEPTNHLDTSSIENIENTLKAFKGTVFFISHDRYFINKTADRILALEGAKLVNYSGNYDDYKAEKEKQQLMKDSSREEMKGKEKKTEYQMKETEKQKKRTGSLRESPESQKDILKGEKNKEKSQKEKSDSQSERLEIQKKRPEQQKEKQEKRKRNLELQIENLEKEIKIISDQMNSPDIQLEELNTLFHKQEELSASLDSCMEEWLGLRDTDI